MFTPTVGQARSDASTEIVSLQLSLIMQQPDHAPCLTLQGTKPIPSGRQAWFSIWPIDSECVW